MFAYIGSRTTRERDARGDGITVCRAEADGALTPVQVLGGLVNPSFLALNRRGDRLYSVHGDGQTCSVLGVDRERGTLTLLQTQSCEGRNPLHLALDAHERHLIVSNHLSGTPVSLPVRDDGSLAPVAQRVALAGTPGPHRDEQPFSKPHFNPFDPSGRFVVVPDLQSCATLGRTPRFFTCHPTAPLLYALNEDSDTVITLRVDPVDGRLTPSGSTLRCGSPVCLIFSS